MNKLTDLDKIRLKELRGNFEELFQGLINQGKISSQNANQILAGINELLTVDVPKFPDKTFEQMTAEQINHYSKFMQNPPKKRKIKAAEWIDCLDCKGKGKYRIIFGKTCEYCEGSGGFFK